LKKGNLSPRLLPTHGPNTAADVARDALRDGADLVLVLGGDGTVNEVVQGVACSGVALGVLPGGTANVLANELGLGSRPELAAERLVSWEPREIALGRITGTDDESRFFLMMCGAGLDASIVYDVHLGLKAAAGKLAYWAAGLGRFGRNLSQLDVCVDGKTYRCGFALISRVRNYGGDLEIASGAALTRDDFEVVLFEGTNSVRYAWYMLGVAARRVQQMRGVRVLRATRVEIPTEIPLQIDGEFIGRRAATIEIVPCAIQLLVPPSHE
jgi:diacylglycerol kinase (ATP)